MITFTTRKQQFDFSMFSIYMNPVKSGTGVWYSGLVLLQCWVLLHTWPSFNLSYSASYSCVLGGSR